LRHPLALAVVAWCTLAASAVAFGDSAPTATKPWARATPPGTSTAAVYVTLSGGTTADRLLEARTPRASMVHLHAIEESGGLAKMRPVDGLDIPAGATIALAPGHMHLMLMGIDRPLVAGERFPLTLHFARAGDRVLDVLVRPATAADPTAVTAH
jgi:copper(I)-binding protein